MRVLLVHGYLLRGTGSNVYTANLARALVRRGHEVHLVCQERAPREIEGVDAAGTWRDGDLEVAAWREPARCTVYQPDIGGLLPVYVADRYEGVEARPFELLGDDELRAYIEANVDAVTRVIARARPDVALAGHLVAAPAILARARSRAGVALPYAVKVHGSALEYTVKPHPRFLGLAREGLAGASCVLVGSRHTAESLWAALGDPGLPGRTRLGPPGVDVRAFGPRDVDDAARGLAALARRLARGPAPGEASSGASGASSFARDPGSAAAVATLDPRRERLVGFVGKLIVSKGADLLVAAWPLVLREVPGARLVIVGFGAWRPSLEGLVAALAAGDLDAVAALAAEGRAGEGGPRSRLAYLDAFLNGLQGRALSRYLAAARDLDARVTFTGRLEHDELRDVLPAMEALVVPSTFPEAFGMVAAEAAACGVLPVSAAHSGLAEVTGVLAARVPEPARPWLSFELGPGTVPALAERVVAWLQAPAALRAQTRDALVQEARRRYSWEGVADGVVAAAQGRLDALHEVPEVVEGVATTSGADDG